MGSLLSKAKSEEVLTPDRNSILKRIEDPRSPTDEVNRTPIEVVDKVPKETIRHIAFANALKEQNKTVYESSPIYSKTEKHDIKKPNYVFAEALDSVPILQADDDSRNSFNISAIEKEKEN